MPAAVFILFVITCFYAFLKPPSDSPSVLYLLMSVSYTMVEVRIRAALQAGLQEKKPGFSGDETVGALHLFALDLCYISVTVPRYIQNSLTNKRSISLAGCAVHVLSVVWVGGSELSILTVRGVLLLGALKVQGLQLVHNALFFLVNLAALTGNLLIVIITVVYQRLHTPMYFFLRTLSVLDLCCISFTVPKSIFNSLTDRREIFFLSCFLQVIFLILLAGTEFSMLTVISHVITQLFYDVLSVIKLSCSKTCLPLRIGLKRSSPVCPHLVVIAVFFSTAAFAHLKPTSSSSFRLDLLVSVFYTVIPPALNHLIYSLRIRDMKMD
ncbi:putative olfactory receptor 14L1 [Tachyglossus aculeatus]|uniref:putative olfactory receptor 14L1 n=1 Tax=Tachyglossus aculeatus TaxID=9261 RepID=UPI0018F3B044|nr:putative olfactory receptor 14L1 [Tachyglossus aculeatus]